LIELSKIDQKVVEQSFYDAMKDLSVTVSSPSLKVYASCGRKALFEMGIKKENLKIPSKPKAKEENELLPSKIKSLPDDDPLKVFFIQRLQHLKTHKSIRSDITIRNMMRFWCTFVCLFETSKHTKFADQDFSVNNVVSLLQTPTDHQIIDVFHMFEGINEEWNSMTMKKLKALYPRNRKARDDVPEATDDKDRHRLSSKQQEEILKACQTPFEKLIVSLLFSTGLRVSGVRMIQLKDICDKTTKPVTIFEYGKTAEKGHKIRTFPIMDMVKPSMLQWIEANHMVDTDYLFPSSRISQQPMAVLNFQTTFKKIAKRAGYEGPEVHVHAARHSVAFNLLESGNSMDKIGKFLGHANPATTAKVYAKMSTKETVERMNTECLGGKNNMKAHLPDVPNFNKTEKRKKKKKYMEKLKSVSISIS
jgi:site-specific recombinase XerD